MSVKIAVTAAVILLHLPLFDAGALSLRVPQPVSLGQEEKETAKNIHAILVSELLRYGVTVSDTEYQAIIYCSFNMEEGGRMLISLSALDPLGELIHFSTIRQARADLTLINAVNRLIEELLPSLPAEENLPSLEALLPPPPFISSFRIQSTDEGAGVYLGGETAVAVITNGEAVIEGFPLLKGVPVPVELRKTGYRPSRIYFRELQEGAVLFFPPLEPELRSDWILAWSVSKALGAGAGIRYFLYPDRVFIASQLFLYGTSSSFSGEAGLAAGTYIITPPESPIRLGLGTAVSLLLRLDQELETDLDYTFLSLLIEYNGKRFTPYLQAELHYLLKESRGYPSVTAGLFIPWRKR